MNTFRKVIFSVTATASLGACAEGNSEAIKPPTASIIKTTTTSGAETTTTTQPKVDLGKVTICGSLKDLNEELNMGTDPRPIAIFGDGKGRKFGSVALLPERTRKAVDKLQSSINTDDNTVRGDQIGVDSLAAIATSRLAADEVQTVLDQYDAYQQTYGEMFDPRAVMDQSVGLGLVLQAREVTSDALKNNCRK